MDDDKIPKFPFVTRDMLRFGKSSQVRLFISVLGVTTTTLLLRFASREGVSEHRISYTGTGARQTFAFNISDIPMFLSLTTEDFSVNQGSIYATVDLQIDQETVQNLCSGYVYRLHSISWPISNNPDIVPGRGGIRMFNGANPAAGSEVSDTVPSGQMWRILQFVVTLVTDANVANRRVHLQINNNSFVGPDVFGSVDQAASTTRKYSFIVGGSPLDELDDNDIIVPLPEHLYVLGSGSVNTVTTNLQAGDDFGFTMYCIEQLYTEEL